MHVSGKVIDNWFTICQCKTAEPNPISLEVRLFW